MLFNLYEIEFSSLQNTAKKDSDKLFLSSSQLENAVLIKNLDEKLFYALTHMVVMLTMRLYSMLPLTPCFTVTVVWFFHRPGNVLINCRTLVLLLRYAAISYPIAESHIMETHQLKILCCPVKRKHIWMSGD